MSRAIDHIVYAVNDLSAATQSLENSLGIAPVIGGHHPQHGTRNALLNLGDGCYLEILAIDKENKDSQTPRWMGIDIIEGPTMTRWAVKSSDLQSDAMTLSHFGYGSFDIATGHRRATSGALLEWQMIVPRATPCVDVVPFMVDWSHSAFHPCQMLETGCRLEALTICTERVDQLTDLFSALDIEERITAGPSKISAKISGPTGVVILS